VHGRKAERRHAPSTLHPASAALTCSPIAGRTRILDRRSRRFESQVRRPLPGGRPSGRKIGRSLRREVVRCSQRMGRRPERRRKRRSALLAGRNARCGRIGWLDVAACSGEELPGSCPSSRSALFAVPADDEHRTMGIERSHWHPGASGAARSMPWPEPAVSPRRDRRGRSAREARGVRAPWNPQGSLQGGAAKADERVEERLSDLRIGESTLRQAHERGRSVDSRRRTGYRFARTGEGFHVSPCEEFRSTRSSDRVGMPTTAG
jgi:hypothetical protein